MPKNLIFNADDFGFSVGVNEGIIDCHRRGVVTSTSLMVTGSAVDQALSLALDHPDLAVGLHFDVWGEDEREFDLNDLAAVRAEFHRQLDFFQALTGTLPTHIDSHRHAHRRDGLMDVFRELVEPLGVPLRDAGSVRFVGHFYAQWEWKVTNLEYISVSQLQRWLHEEVQEGWTEFSCHPGYATPDYSAVYYVEREEEIRTLTDPRIKQTLADLEIDLVSYKDYSRRPRA